VVIGGLARVIRGADEITREVDITPSFAKDNLARLAPALQELDARRTDRRKLTVSDIGLSDGVVKLSTNAGGLNIIAPPLRRPTGSPTSDARRRRSTSATAGGRSSRLPGLSDAQHGVIFLAAGVVVIVHGVLG
jgi:hypothetical protein